ncbi:MAG: hypothetical protein J3Q66DRAFT_341587 [Benniella sp.]|nr:MAG: hypothetical protein J3Q66DRAFT_341587 [Benniella sp.]
MLMPATAILPPHSTDPSTTASNSSSVLRNPLVTDSAAPRCPGCDGTNIVEEQSIGAVVCHDCGSVLEETVLDTTPARDPGGLTRVTNRGRAWNSASEPRAGQSILRTTISTIERRRIHRSKRFEDIRKCLASTGRLSGLTGADVSRGYHLWRVAMFTLRLRGWDIAYKGAVACLFIAAKERKKGTTLFGIAAQAGASPYKIGAMYKQIRTVLVERKILDDNECLHSDDDPRIMLEKILSIGSSDSMNRGDMDQLSQQFRAAFDVDGSTDKRAACLRLLWSSAQKCMAIAMDAGLTIGRHPRALAGACLVIAVEVKLLLTGYSKELVDFSAAFFGCGSSTVKARYKELRECMLVWANRLPFLNANRAIKPKMLVYHLEDVIKYFGHLENQNKQLWAMLDKDESVISDRDNIDENDDDENIYECDRLGYEGEFTEEDLRLAQELRDSDSVGDANDYEVVPCDDSDTHRSEHAQQITGVQKQHPPSFLSDVGQEDSDVKFDPKLYPPSYVANMKQTQRRINITQIAKGEAEYSGPSPRSRRPRAEHIERRRIEVVKRLLELGNRSEKELSEALEGTLEYWLVADQAKASGSNEPRSQEEMDAVELGPKDLSQPELESYLRTPAETKAISQVMASTFSESDKRAQKRPETGQQQKRKRSVTPSTTDQATKKPKKARSSKINWEALGELDGESITKAIDEDEAQTPTQADQYDQDEFDDGRGEIEDNHGMAGEDYFDDAEWDDAAGDYGYDYD